MQSSPHCHCDHSNRHFLVQEFEPIWWRLLWGTLATKAIPTSATDLRTYAHLATIRICPHSPILEKRPPGNICAELSESIFRLVFSVTSRWSTNDARHKQTLRPQFTQWRYIRDYGKDILCKQKGGTAVKVSSRVYLTFCLECNKAFNAIVLLITVNGARRQYVDQTDIFFSIEIVVAMQKEYNWVHK